MYVSSISPQSKTKPKFPFRFIVANFLVWSPPWLYASSVKNKIRKFWSIESRLGCFMWSLENNYLNKFLVLFLSWVEFLFKPTENNYLKIRKNRNYFFKPTFPPKNEQKNSISLLWDLFSFVFWRKLMTPKRHFKINWPLRP